MEVQIGRRLGHEKIDDLVLGHSAAHIGTVFDLLFPDRIKAGDPKLLSKPPLGAVAWRLAPQRMGAAGVRPKSGRVIFVHRALLYQYTPTVHHEYADRFVLEPAHMRVQLFHWLQFAVFPGRNHDRHVRNGDTRRVKCARFLIPILRCAIGRAFTSFLFIYASNVSFCTSTSWHSDTNRSRRSSLR